MLAIDLVINHPVLHDTSGWIVAELGGDAIELEKDGTHQEDDWHPQNLPEHVDCELHRLRTFLDSSNLSFCFFHMLIFGCAIDGWFHSVAIWVDISYTTTSFIETYFKVLKFGIIHDCDDGESSLCIHITNSFDLLGVSAVFLARYTFGRDKNNVSWYV